MPEMFARIPSALLPRRGHWLLLSAVVGLSLVPSCTKSEDTEPFVPASPGATQPEAGGSLLSEEDACSRLADALSKARRRLGCGGPKPAECPGFIRPGGGSGCYEYSEDSVAACENTYADAFSCQGLAPCIVTAERNDDLPTCDTVSGGEGGAAGATSVAGAANGGAGAGGAPTEPAAGGAPSDGGAAGAPLEQGGAAAGGAAAGGAGG